jgi:3-hydroxyacyl-CoA dehydrogenase
LHEAFALVQDGCVSARDIDKAMTEGLGLRWSVVGPFETIDLNAPNGVSDYAQRYGKMYLDFATERGPATPWTTQVIEEVNKSMREELSLSEIPNRQTWRDRRLMSLAAHNKNNPS